MGLIYENLTHELIGCFFYVHNSIGVGYDERTYHKALEYDFRKKGVPHSSEEHRTLIHRDSIVKELKADFITFGRIILELKALRSGFIRSNYIQIISELKLWNMRLGILVNFGLQKVQFERIPFTEKPKAINENFDHVRESITAIDRDILARVRDAILYVFETHGLGYGEVLCRRLVEAELNFRQITYQNRCPIQVSYENRTINTFKMKPLLLMNRVICDIKALDEKIDFYDVAKIQAYLRALDLKTGLIVNFGKTELQIRGVGV